MVHVTLLGLVLRGLDHLVRALFCRTKKIYMNDVERA